MADLENILSSRKFKCNVSSVLNKDIKMNGKSFLFDGLDDTAWSSDQGNPQVITITFDEPIENVILSQSYVAIKFQGGFVGSQCKLKLENEHGNVVHEITFYPDDINEKQQFPLTNETSNQKGSCNITKARLIFEKCSDFFGRIIIYNLELFCHSISNS